MSFVHYKNMPMQYTAIFHGCKNDKFDLQETYLQEIDVRLSKKFCFLDADCLVVGESQSSSRRLARKYPVKPPRPEDDSQTIDTVIWPSTALVDFFFLLFHTFAQNTYRGYRF